MNYMLVKHKNSKQLMKPLMYGSKNSIRITCMYTYTPVTTMRIFVWLKVTFRLSDMIGKVRELSAPIRYTTESLFISVEGMFSLIRLPPLLKRVKSHREKTDVMGYTSIGASRTVI